MLPNRIFFQVILSIPFLLGVFLIGCKKQQAVTAPNVTTAAITAAAISENNRGMGLMGRFEFDQAVGVFAALSSGHDDWTDVQLNQGIATLNRQQTDDSAEALRIFDRILQRDPNQLRAQYCKGLLLLNGGKPVEAEACFRHVADVDANDAYAVYYVGLCLSSSGKASEALAYYQKAQALDPLLRSAYYGAFQCFQQAGHDAEAKLQLSIFEKLASNPQARLVEFKYTRMGSKAEVVALSLPNSTPVAPPSGAIFTDSTPLTILNPQVLDGLTWRNAVERGDGAPDHPVGITAVDIDGDGRLDLFITNALVDAQGALRNAVLIQRNGGFEIDLKHPLANVPDVNAALWGDFDNDGLTDVYLCRRHSNQLWHHAKPAVWEDVTASTHTAGENFNTIDGAWVDADHDGDLDLFLIRSDGPNELFNNNLDGTFRPLAREHRLAGDGSGATGLIVTDLNHDGVVDLVVLKRQPPHEVYINDRLWAYHAGKGFDEFLKAPVFAAVAADPDANGQNKLFALSADGLTKWTPNGQGVWQPELMKVAGTASNPLSQPTSGFPSAILAVADVDGTGSLQILQSENARWATLPIGRSSTIAASLNQSLTFSAKGPPLLSWAFVQLDAGIGPSVVGLPAGGPPVIWRPGPGRLPFVTLALTGKTSKADSMRSNASGTGVALAARVDSRWTVLDTYRPQSGPGQSQQPIAFGLGGAPKADFVRMIWPDAVQQTEVDLQPGQTLRIEETQRQTSSCPLIFVWDGTHYAFVTDCLGVGGIGFATGPGEYAPVRPWENVLLPAGLMRPKNGQYEIKVSEPMEEACYLDSASLVEYDLPPGWSMTLDERMGINDPQPTGNARFYRTRLLPLRAINDRGEDVTAQVTVADGQAAEPGLRDSRFIGLTREHSITLEFDKALDEAATGDLTLLADGWIEYPYSQTMFAAWQAGANYAAPTLEGKGRDGKWAVILDQFGYPAGMPRQMSVPIPRAKLPAGTTALRLRTNQEIYWDCLAIAWAEPCPDARRRVISLKKGTLSDVGFPRRSTGPQHRPMYDYDHRLPLWDTRRQRGFYTAFGSVDELLRETDDALAIFGPGEEIQLEFAPSGNNPPPGWTRRLVLELAGWCKDRDLYTKDGETIHPLPRRDIANGKSTDTSDRLHLKYNTRYQAGG